MDAKFVLERVVLLKKGINNIILFNRIDDEFEEAFGGVFTCGDCGGKIDLNTGICIECGVNNIE